LIIENGDKKEMKIRINPKAHAYVFMRTSPGGKYHIAFNARPHHTVETCRDAWEEVVADKAPEEWQDLDSQPITTGPLTGGHHEIHTPNWSIVALDAGGYKVLIEGTKYVKKFKFEAGDTFVYNEENWAVVFNEIGRLEEERDELKTKLAAIESRREEDVKAYAVIQEERDELLEAQVALMKERNEWKAATHLGGKAETKLKPYLAPGHTRNPEPDPGHTGNKYIRTIQGRFPDDPDTRVDVYCVIDAFEVERGPIDHALKKLLCAGIRGKNDKLQDLVEARDAISRSIEMEERRIKTGESK